MEDENGLGALYEVFIPWSICWRMDGIYTYRWARSGKIREKIYAKRVILGCLLTENTLIWEIPAYEKINPLTSISIRIRRWNTTQNREEEWTRLPLAKRQHQDQPRQKVLNGEHTRWSDQTSNIWHANEVGNEGEGRQPAGFVKNWFWGHLYQSSVSVVDDITTFWIDQPRFCDIRATFGCTRRPEPIQWDFRKAWG